MIIGYCEIKRAECILREYVVVPAVSNPVKSHAVLSERPRSRFLRSAALKPVGS